MERVLSRVFWASLAVWGLACDGGSEESASDAGAPDASGSAGIDAGGSADARPPAIDGAPPAIDAGGGGSSKVIFVTSTVHSGALGGASGADSICGSRASEAGLTGTFKAWLSTGDTSAADRLNHATVPYVRTDGTQVADGWDDLVDGAIDAPINRDEDGAAASGDVWTGTLSDGTSHAEHCAGFTSGDFSDSGLCGSSDSSGADWTANIVPFCTTQLRIYCVEQ